VHVCISHAQFIRPVTMIELQTQSESSTTYSLFDWLLREEILLAGLCERKILLRSNLTDHENGGGARRPPCLHAGHTTS